MEQGKDTASDESSPDPSRQPYEKPRVVWEQPLEAQPSLMAGCQKIPGGGSDCTAVGPVSS
jgi:hypothetical protein